jgi:hypothetical protein
VWFCIYHRLRRQEQPRRLGRPRTERSLRRPVRQPSPSRQIRAVHEWPSSRDNRRAVGRHRTRHVWQASLLRSPTAGSGTSCRIPRGQHAVGLITGHNSLRANEASLAEISPFLCTTAAIAVLIDSRESATCLKIRAKLEQMGFRIQAGVRCQQGLVLSAYRQSFSQMENAA